MCSPYCQKETWWVLDHQNWIYVNVWIQNIRTRFQVIRRIFVNCIMCTYKFSLVSIWKEDLLVDLFALLIHWGWAWTPSLDTPSYQTQRDSQKYWQTTLKHRVLWLLVQYIRTSGSIVSLLWEPVGGTVRNWWADALDLAIQSNFGHNGICNIATILGV